MPRLLPVKANVKSDVPLVAKTVGNLLALRATRLNLELPPATAIPTAS